MATAAKTDDDAPEASHPAPPARPAGGHTPARRELKPWEAEERVEQAEVHLDLAKAEAARTLAMQAAHTALEHPAQERDAARKHATDAHKAVVHVHAEIKRIAEQLNSSVQRIDAEKETLPVLIRKLGDADKHLADLKTAQQAMLKLTDDAHQAQLAQKAAEDAFAQAEPLAKAQYDVDRLNAELAYAKVEATSRRKQSDIKKKFADRIDEF